MIASTRRLLQPAVCLLGLAVLAGCATTGPDPLEPMNRKLFWVNEQADHFVLEPVASVWDVFVPELLQTGFRNFFSNLNMPVVFANDILQLKPRAALDDLARLTFNTIFGMAGFFDVATREGIPKHDEDFGQTLGSWGVPPGPYLVVPFLGPSSPRDAVGFAVDTAGGVHNYFIPLWAAYAVSGTRIVNGRARYLEEVRESRREALDYYVFVRNAWVQNRQQRVSDAVDMPAEAEDDLYFFDEAEDNVEVE